MEQLLDRKIKAMTNLISEPHVKIDTNIGDCYQQCLPDETVDIAFCMFVLQWLSRPCAIRNGLVWLDAVDEELKFIKTRAEEDWKTFLNSRTRELKSGGFLIAVFPGNGNQEYATIARNAFKEMRQRNEISQDEVARTALNLYGDRTESDITKPFEDGFIKDLTLIYVTNKTIYLKDLGITHGLHFAWFLTLKFKNKLQKMAFPLANIDSVMPSSSS